MNKIADMTKIDGNTTLSKAIALVHEAGGETYEQVGYDEEDEAICAVIVITGPRTGRILQGFQFIMDELDDEDDLADENC